jgi:hypothetical protein
MTTEPEQGYLLIPSDPAEPTSVLAATKETSLAVLQGAVDGYVECISLAADADMWCNDEGKYRPDFERNPRAQALFDHAFGEGLDVIVGPVVITRGADDEGETIPLGPREVAKLRSIFEEA